MELEGVTPNTIRNSILVPFVDETIKALQSMADLKGGSDLLSYHPPLDIFQFKSFAVSIVAKTQNDIAGKIVMTFDLDTALVVGNRVRQMLLGVPENHTVLNNEISEALAEFSNTVIGLATQHLTSASQKITFGPPMYLYSEEDCEFILNGVQQILTVPIDIKDVGRFYFSYLLHNRVG